MQVTEVKDLVVQKAVRSVTQMYCSVFSLQQLIISKS